MPEPGADNEDVPSSLGWTKLRQYSRAIFYCCLIGALVVPGVEAYRVFFGANFHTLIPGRVYRSAQLSPTQLERKLRANHIHTVINLRGNCDPCPWYLEESRVTNRTNVCQEDICFSAGHLPSVSEVRRLVTVLDRTEYPILLHCRRGADRTGMTSAIVLLLQKHATLRQARAQLGLRYGHVALGRPANLDAFLDLYDEWLRNEGRTHSPAVFRHWLLNGYCPAECRCEIHTLVPPVIVQGKPFTVRARFCNTSMRPWHLRAGSNAGIHGSYLLWDPLGKVVVSGRSGLFDANVPPGESIDLTLAFPALSSPGKHRLQVDMVGEQHCVFHQAGSEPFEQDLYVQDSVIRSKQSSSLTTDYGLRTTDATREGRE